MENSFYEITSGDTVVTGRYLSQRLEDTLNETGVGQEVCPPDIMRREHGPSYGEAPNLLKKTGYTCESEKNRQGLCPDCGTGMVRQGNCFNCPSCGWGCCG